MNNHLFVTFVLFLLLTLKPFCTHAQHPIEVKDDVVHIEVQLDLDSFEIAGISYLFPRDWIVVPVGNEVHAYPSTWDVVQNFYAPSSWTTYEKHGQTIIWPDITKYSFKTWERQKIPNCISNDLGDCFVNCLVYSNEFDWILCDSGDHKNHFYLTGWIVHETSRGAKFHRPTEWYVMETDHSYICYPAHWELVSNGTEAYALPADWYFDQKTPGGFIRWTDHGCEIVYNQPEWARYIETLIRYDEEKALEYALYRVLNP
ncbi:MAG: hypothetical protein OEQ53_10950 [Saprospiraceae bacterium]|nr:hypothetical protein [Saprospiraceae bacterium]